MACGKIDRRMSCLFRRVHRLQPHNEGERELEERRGIHQSRVMIKTTKRSDRKRKRMGDYWKERDTLEKSHDGDSNGEQQRDLHSVKRVSVLLKDLHMHT